MSKVLITGASRGFGLEIRKVFEAKGFECICPSRATLDLSSTESIESFLFSFNDKIDVLVNNAGINIKAGLEDISASDVEAMYKTNLLGPLMLMQGLVPKMTDNTISHVVNIGSIWGVTSIEQRAMYSMTKFGIDGMTKAIAQEYGKHNVLLNTVAPGFMNTEMTRKNLSQTKMEELSRNIPLGRFAEPNEIAKLVYFLCSPDNTYITGQTIIADGGFLS